MMVEWKPVKGYEGLYEVSNTGLVRSVDRVVVAKNGVRKKLKGKELFFTISKIDAKGRQPRARVQLWKDNKAILRQVHRIVATAFIPNPEGKATVNHKDGNPLNNSVENLEWATYSENQIHAVKTGLITYRTGFLPGNSRKVIAYNEKTGDEIVCDSCQQMAEMIGVCHQRVSRCAAENEDIKTSTCKGYIIKYL